MYVILVMLHHLHHLLTKITAIPTSDPPKSIVKDLLLAARPGFRV